MKRSLWSFGLIASALFVSLNTPVFGQNVECCSYRVRHNFRICLPNCQIVAVDWRWHAQASAWVPLTTNTNSGTQTYSIPSSDVKCASAVAGQDCAFSSACARFQVDWIPGTQCIQGFHEAFGRACVRCRGYGSNAISASGITIRCGTPNAAGTINWQPLLQDTVQGGCGVQMQDPVILRLRNPATGEERDDVLFDLRAQGALTWEIQDLDGDGWGDTARLNYCCLPDVIMDGGITARVGGDSLTGQGGELRLSVRSGIVTESFKSGIFDGIQLPNVGERMPSSIEVPHEFDLSFRVPRGWELESVQIGGSGESGDTPPPPGDVNGDGCVDDSDLLAVLFAFGGQGGAEDLNGDGVVDDADLLIVLFNFGTGC
ncbi:MAG: hypothetical protein N2045_09985 [Fimbriimonadales bacterium]|nr:hypothetical protein [Fimbriimonadales bacterium]GBC91051.1 hypothetical protein HRbin14_01808 [bacterium HR14]